MRLPKLEMAACGAFLNKSIDWAHLQIVPFEHLLNQIVGVHDLAYPRNFGFEKI